MSKIICIIESLGQGGAERQISYLAVLLKKTGRDVELWTYYPNDFNKPILDQYQVTYRYIEAAQNKYKRISVLRKELKKSKADVVISYMDTCSMSLCLVKILGGKFRLLVSERSSTRTIDAHTRLKFLLYRYADVVIPNSYSETNTIKAHFPFLKDKISTIVNFVDLEKFSIPQKQLCNTDGSIIIIGVGRITTAKNLIRLADAIKKVIDSGYNIKLNWYGDVTNEQLNEQLKERIMLHGISDRFMLHPATRDIVEHYHHADVFCLASIYEGFPNVICEAMSCGLPVLCSNVCDNGIIVQDKINGVLFDPLSVDDITRAFVEYINTMHVNRKNIGLRNRERITEMCSENSFVGNYIKLIEP